MEAYIKNEKLTKNKRDNKLYILAAIVGIITGITVSAYRFFLEFITSFVKILSTSVDGFSLPNALFIWVISLSLSLLVVFSLKKYPYISGSGIPQVRALLLDKIDYVHYPIQLLLKFLGGLVGGLAGLSLGREGPSIQMGSYIGYGFAKFYKEGSVESKLLITSGASAGLSGAFAAPLSGVVFVIEELRKYFSPKLLTCTLIASIMSDFICRRLFGLEPTFAFDVSTINLSVSTLSISILLIGIATSITGKLFTLSLVSVGDYLKKLNPYLKATLIVTLSIILIYYFPIVNGGGHSLLEEIFLSNDVVTLLLIALIGKLLFTALSYSTSFPGGIFLPMLVLGGLTGKIVALLLVKYFNFPVDVAKLGVILGMAGFFVAVVKAPLTGIILILEMTGSFEFLLAIITVSLVSYFVTRYLHLEPIYDILYNKLIVKEKNISHGQKSILIIPVASESALDNKAISEIEWPPETLVINIDRDDDEIIPNGSTLILPGDKLTILMDKSVSKEHSDTLLSLGLSE